MDPQPLTTSRRVLALLIDSLDLQEVQKGVDEGWMPSVAALVRSGRSASLVGPNRILPGAAWTTLSTGTSPHEHLLMFDRQLRPGTYEMDLVTSEAARRPPFWRYISDAGLSSVILSVYGTPFVTPFLGTQVIEWGSHDPFAANAGPPSSIPAKVVEDLDRSIGQRGRLTLKKLPRSIADYREVLRMYLEGIPLHTAAILHLLEREEWSFFAAGISEPHQAGHLIWHHHDPTHPRHDPSAPDDVKASITSLYKAVDDSVGAIAAAVPKDCTFLVATAHGMGPWYLPGDPLEPLLRTGGWLGTRPGPGRSATGLRHWALRTGRRAAHRFLPESVRSVLGSKLPADRWELETTFSHVDWTHTRAFALPADRCSFLRINLQGREPEGIVSREGYDQLCEELTAVLKELKDADTGEPVVDEVIRLDQHFGIEVRDVLPDLCVIWREERRIRRIRDPRFGTITLQNVERRTGHHRPRGWVAAVGPGIQASHSTRIGEAGEFNLLDIGPTVLSQLSIGSPGLPGTPIEPLVS